MNENFFRPQFDKLKLTDKLWLMQTLATRYNLTFKEPVSYTHLLWMGFRPFMP